MKMIDVEAKTRCSSSLVSLRIHVDLGEILLRHYLCHAAQAAHDWRRGIIHVQHHVSHAGNDSAHGGNTVFSVAMLQQAAENIPAPSPEQLTDLLWFMMMEGTSMFWTTRGT